MTFRLWLLEKLPKELYQYFDLQELFSIIFLDNLYSCCIYVAYVTFTHLQRSHDCVGLLPIE